MAVGAASSLLLKAILTVYNVELRNKNMLLKQREPLVEVVVYEQGMISNSLCCYTGAALLSVSR